MFKKAPRAKRIKAILITLLCIAFCFIATRCILNNITRTRMLQAVGLGESTGLRQEDYAYWCDPLKYIDGYEIMAFAVDEAVWSAPDSWNTEMQLASVDAIAAKLGININTDAILNLSLGGENCGTWFFVDNRANRTFDEQDFYFAYCDETYSDSVVLFIYRGHHMYWI